MVIISIRVWWLIHSYCSKLTQTQTFPETKIKICSSTNIIIYEKNGNQRFNISIITQYSKLTVNLLYSVHCSKKFEVCVWSYSPVVLCMSASKLKDILIAYGLKQHSSTTLEEEREMTIIYAFIFLTILDKPNKKKRSFITKGNGSRNIHKAELQYSNIVVYVTIQPETPENHQNVHCLSNSLLHFLFLNKILCSHRQHNWSKYSKSSANQTDRDKERVD